MITFFTYYTSGMVLTSQRAVEAMERCVNELISHEGKELSFLRFTQLAIDKELSVASVATIK